LGRNKAVVMAEASLDINPELDVRVFEEAIDDGNVGEFLKGADLFVDGLDFFAIDARRLVFRRAAQTGIWAVTAGPVGFSTAWLAFDPTGMSLDQYFDLNDGMSRLDQLIAFAIGLAPRALHVPYLDLRQVSIAEECGPSAALACQLASGVICAQALQIILGRSKRLAAPTHYQFDAYRSRFVRGRLPFGNRSLRQRIKRYVLSRRLRGLQP
jgi:ThiF family